MPENKHVKVFIIILYILLGFGVLWLCLNYFIGWVMPFIIAFALAQMIEKPILLTEQKLKIPRRISSLVFTLLAFTALFTVIYFLGAELIKQAATLAMKIPDTQTITIYVKSIFRDFLLSLPSDVANTINMVFDKIIAQGITIPKEVFTTIGSWAGKVAASIPSIFLFVIASLVATYLLSSDYPTIKRFFSERISERLKSRLSNLKTNSFKTLFKYLRAMSIVLSLTFVELLIGLSLLRVEYTVLYALLIAIVDVLPILGTGTILIPWGIISLLTGNYPLGIGLLILYAVIGIIRNIVEPKIVGKQIGLHPLITLVSIYVGIKMFGAGGLLFPILIVIIKQAYISFNPELQSQDSSSSGVRKKSSKQ